MARALEWHEIEPHLTPAEVLAFTERIERREWLLCWEWKGGRNAHGYGCFTIWGRTLLAPRLAYGLARGGIPYGKEIAHHCDDPGCCNPTHLFPATHAENMRDASEKGRKRWSAETVRRQAEKRRHRVA